MAKQEIKSSKQVAKNTTSSRVRPSSQGSKVVKKTVKKNIWEFPLTKQNFIIGAIGIGVILIGFALMATGITNEPAVEHGKWNNPFAVSVAPALLVIGYCIIIPYAILKFFGKKKEDEQVQ